MTTGRTGGQRTTKAEWTTGRTHGQMTTGWTTDRRDERTEDNYDYDDGTEDDRRTEDGQTTTTTGRRTGVYLYIHCKIFEKDIGAEM